MHEPHDRPLRQILHAVSAELEQHTNGQDANEADERPLEPGEVPPLGNQGAEAVRRATEQVAADLERAAQVMRYAGNKLASDIEMFTGLALLISTKIRTVTER